MSDFKFEPITKDTSLREPWESKMDLFLWKYNYAFAVNLLEDFVKKVEEDDNILFVQQLFKWTWLSSSYLGKLIKHFDTEPYIEVLANRIFDTLEARVLEKWLYNETNSWLTQFYLKNKFNWKDKVDIDQTTTNVVEDNMTDEQKKMIAERYITITD